MKWIYLSPHLDDAALSCGGAVWEQAKQGQAVEIWTVCAGDPPPGELSPFARGLHDRWEVEASSAAGRRAEDVASCRELNASHRHFAIPDCIYRGGESGWLYDSEEALFGSLQAGDLPLVEKLSAALEAALPGSAALVCPLALGNHVDHQLTRAAVERLVRLAKGSRTWQVWYYADYPYAREKGDQLAAMRAEGWVSRTIPVSPEGLAAWARGVTAHRSQISTFWRDLQAMRADLEAYDRQAGGVRLWAKPGEQTF